MNGSAHSAVVQPLEAGALLRLSLEGAAPSFTWAHPSRGIWAAGLGEAASAIGTVQWQGEAPAGMPGPFFGGFNFEGVEQWRLPRVLAFWSAGRNWAAAFDDPTAFARLSEAEPVVAENAGRRAGGTTVDHWNALVAKALTAIRGRAMSKVVVARTIEVECERPIEVRRVLKALEARFPTCRTFSFRTGEETFVGATPELLGEASGGRFSTEALAGTSSRADAAALLKSEKDRAEHQAVVDGIRASLSKVTQGIEHAAEPELRLLANVAHLCTPISAALPEGDDGFSFARALHPTAATCGTPREAAQAFLKRHEGFDRGWYAGAVGYRGAGSMHLSVALRCATIRGNQATLYVGAGIVEGSTAEAEWLETERKASTMLSALGVTP
ncbi:MAG: isochorismate synthase [Myxococcaceae bacterium]